MWETAYSAGGTQSQGFSDVRWRPDGVLVLIGSTYLDDLPLKDPIQSTISSRPNWTHAYLTMINDDGSSLRYSSYIGGSSASIARALTIDERGRIHVTGFANFRGFPLKNALYDEAEGFHGFLTVFDPTGQERLYSTLIPGVEARSVALDADGGIVVGGDARSSDVPLRDSLQPFRGGGVAGTDGFLMKFSADGRALLLSTLMGGTNGDFQRRLAVGPDKSIYVSGASISSDFPLKNAYQPQFGGGNDAILYRITDNSVLPTAAAPFSVSPSRLTFRFIQGEAAPAALPVAIGGLTGQVFAASNVPWLRVTPAGLGVSGTMSFSVDPSVLPPGVHQGSVRLTPSSGAAATVDVTFTVLAAAPLLLSVEPSTVPVGTDDTEITLRGAGFTNRTTVQLQAIPWLLTAIRLIDATTLKLTLPKAYFSAEYNHSITVQNPDSAVSKPVSLAVGRPAPSIANKGIVSAASYAGDVISPGEILTIFGENFEPGMRVNFAGLLATPLYITPTQLSVVAPPGLAGAREANVIVEMNFDWRSIPVKIPVWPAHPGLFTANGTGKGLAAALNQDTTLNTTANPAKKGDIIVLWGTGGGVESLPQKVFIDGIESEILYAAGKDGLWQLNVRIPEFASKGEVVWQAGERESGDAVYLSLRE